MTGTSRTIKVDTLARVEGEGSLYIKLVGERVTDVKLKIFEPPRMFEAFLRDRHFSEAADITARICGICPIAYQMSAVHAIERALGLRIDPAVRLLRRLFYCGEWIESHTLHVYMLHAPDFLGYADVIEMARDHREVVEAGAAAEEDRQSSCASARRARDSSDLGGGWRLSSGAHQTAAARISAGSGMGVGSVLRSRAMDLIA